MTPLLNLSALIIQTILYVVAYLPTRFFTGFKVKGARNLQNLPAGGVIIMSNHASQIDPGLLDFALPWNRRFRPGYIVSLTKEHYLHLPLGKWLFGGRFFTLGGSYPVYLKKETLEESLPHHIKLLNKGKLVVIFPEGKLSRDGKLGSARPGVAFLAHKTGAMIIPTYIAGDYLLTAKDFFGRKRHMSVTFSKHIRFSDYGEVGKVYTREEYRDIAEKMFSKVRDLAIEDISKEGKDINEKV